MTKPVAPQRVSIDRHRMSQIVKAGGKGLEPSTLARYLNSNQTHISLSRLHGRL